MTRVAVAILVLVAACESEAPDVEPRLLASGSSASYALAYADDALYWTGSQGVWQLSLQDGNLVAIGDGTPAIGLAVSGDDVFWAADGNVLAAPIDGGREPQIIAVDQPCVFAMAADDRSVYWGSIVDRTVWRWDRQTEQLHRLAENERNVSGVAVADGRVYWSAGSGHVRSIRAGGTEPLEHVAGLEWPRSVAVADGAVYWADSDGTIGRVSIDGGETSVVTTTEPFWSLGRILTADEDGVYWAAKRAEDDDGAVYGMEHGASNPTTLAADAATAVVTGPDDVYWVTADGRVMARPRP